MALLDIASNGYLPDMSDPYYTQDYVSVKDMYGGMIETKDGKFIRILEVLPVNFESRSIQERDDIISDFREWLSIAPMNFQIKIITEGSNTQKIVDQSLERYKRDKDYDVKNVLRHYTDLLSDLGNRGAVSRRFYLIISHENKNTSKKKLTVDDIYYELEDSVASIQAYFSKMGSVVTTLSESGDPSDEQWAVMDFLYKLYNPRTSSNEPDKPAVTLTEKVDRIFADKRKICRKEDVQISVDDIVAPKSIDITRPDAIVLDGRYYTYLLVSGSGYPNLTTAGWFPAYFSFGPGEYVDMFVSKIDPDRFNSRIGSKIRALDVKLSEKNSTQLGYENTESALTGAQYMKEMMSSGSEFPFFLTTLITITGDSYEYVMKRKEIIVDYFKSKSIKTFSLRNIQEESMRSSFPFIDLSPKLYFKGKRNMLTSGVASCFPFVAAEIQDDGGVMLGLDLVNNAPCVINPFNTKNYKNANMVILGTAGAGKTYTEQLMALRMRTNGWQCFILAPDKAHEFQRACAYGVKGEFIKIAPSSTDHINIMDIRPNNSEAARLLQGEAADNTVLVSEKSSAIITFISLLIPDLSNEEEQIIDTCIMRTYAEYGITEDNDSIYIDPRNKAKGLKKMPILGDLYEELQKAGISDRILKILSQFITGSAKSFNNRTNVDLKNKYIVFDLSSLKDRILPAGMFVALDFIVGRIKEDVTERKMVFIDEGWQLIGSGANEKAAEYVKWLFKIIRGYNGGACIATQDIKDFFALKGGEYGNAILSNSQIKMLLNLSPNEAEFVQEELKLTREEIRNLKNFSRGQCLICAGTDHIPVQIIGSDYETDLITTDPNRVPEVLRKMKEQGGKLE